MIIFDNYYSSTRSRVVEFDPATKKIVWNYSNDDGPFFSSILSIIPFKLIVLNPLELNGISQDAKTSVSISLKGALYLSHRLGDYPLRLML